MACTYSKGRARTARLSFLSFAAVLMLGACSPPTPPNEPAEGTFAAASLALRTGNLAALQVNLGLLPSRRVAVRPFKLDPEAWLVVQGARWREHDLAACYRATSAEQLAIPLGFSPDSLTASLLDSPSRMSERMAGGRRYFLSVDAPLDLVQSFDFKLASPASSAWLLRYQAILAERPCTLWAGHNGQHVTELRADESAYQATSAPGNNGGQDLAALLQSRAPDVALGLRDAPILRRLPLSARSIEVLAVDASGTLFELHAIAHTNGWQILRANQSHLQDRLNEQRDEALQVILQAALDYERRTGRWPTKASLTLPAAQWVDASAEAGELGWQRYAAKPVVGIGLSQSAPADDKPAVYCLQGGRGITRVGNLIN